MRSNVKSTCPFCRSINVVEVETVNHLLHLLMSVLTVGMWLIIWVLIVMSNGDNTNLYLCHSCGKDYLA